jgi:hypothetical protein
VFTFTLSLLFGRQRQSIRTDPWFIVGAAVLLLVTVTA